ncbi:(2Fe-2S)-binding protein [Streptomyces sp. DSM 44917]|uniref:(2Fe-2S)-binding protein n=1 Tax=Streptomyces boetiae TaxID=3075541 RepID=A0ABU2L2G5_9ACTN|nr:(2Fe-2S)-binding protein [Streptomyces sp. DSM 44917]MDT0305747.1 (2Fe-2S)-binding protein [Streptomyces sp. DSM 44917]
MTVPALAAEAPATPLAPAFVRVTEVLPELRITEERPRRGPGWISAAGLAAGGAEFEAFLAAEDARIEEEYGRRARPDVVAAFALHRYAWQAAVLLTMPWFLLRRVPSVAPGDVSFHREGGRVTVRAGAFACLPDDPAAGHPGARVAGGEAALRKAVREAAVAHFGPLLAAFGPRMRRGPRALWGAVADELTEALWYLGGLLDEERRAVEEATALLPAGTRPFGRGAAFRELLSPRGEALLTRDRASCCFYYTLRPDDACLTCPRTCDSERVTRLTAG